jgi:excisionase family DNA binding protein
VVDERWFTVEQIAELLQVHEQTVRRWLRDGALAGRNFGGRTGYRVPESALKTFLEQTPDAKRVA